MGNLLGYVLDERIEKLGPVDRGVALRLGVGSANEFLLISLAISPFEPDARGDSGGLVIKLLLEPELGQRVASVLAKGDTCADFCELRLMERKRQRKRKRGRTGKGG